MIDDLPEEKHVTPLELAQTLQRYSRTQSPLTWEELDGKTRDRLVLEARLALDALADRRLTDAHKRAISRLESAAHDVAEAAGDAVENALQSSGVDEREVRLDGRREGIRYVIRELDRRLFSDTLGGSTPLDDALRALERETR